jgi:hypothetical protein
MLKIFWTSLEITGRNLFAAVIKSLNTKLNPICHLLALFGAHHILHVSRIRVKPIASTAVWV